MSAELYNQIYRCRKCGKEFCTVTICGREKTKEHMDNFASRVNGKRAVHLQLAPVLYMAHYCKNGDIGVADFIGYLGVEPDEDEVTLYADDIPYASVKNTNYPLRTWDYERHDWITLEHCRTIDDVVWHYNNGDCTLNEARAWCFVNNASLYELLRRTTEPYSYPAEFTGVYNTKPQKKEPWPYRLVTFLNRVLEILLNSILDDFV